jgi:hypothetical protein
MERYVYSSNPIEFSSKIAHIILNARIPFGLDTGKKMPNKSYFLEIPEIHAINKQLTTILGMKPRSLYVDIYVTVTRNSETKSILLERWCIHRDVDSKDQTDSTWYMKSCIIMRSIYTYSLSLPAYQLYKKYLKNRNENISLSFVLDTTEPNIGFPNDIQPPRVELGVVNTPNQKLRVFVQYRETFELDDKQIEKREILTNYFDAQPETRRRATSTKGIKKEDRHSVEERRLSDLKAGSMPAKQFFSEKMEKKEIPFKIGPSPDHFSKSPPFGKTDPTDSPFSQPSSLNSPPFESTLAKQFSGGSQGKRSFKFGFSPFNETIKSPTPGTTPPIKIIEKSESGVTIVNPLASMTPTASLVITKKSPSVEIHPFLQYRLKDDKIDDDEELMLLEDSGLAFTSTNSDEEDGDVEGLLRKVENPPGMKSFENGRGKQPISTFIQEFQRIANEYSK